MADPFNVIEVPVIVVDVENAIPTLEVTIDKTGPAGPPGGVTNHAQLTNIGTNTHAQIDTHIADGSDPHGATLVQTNLAAIKASVGVTNAGPISTSQTINFANCGCYVCTATGTLNLTVSSLAAGQRGSVHILAGATPPAISWSGVGIWISGVPTYAAGKLTVVTLFNDGVRIVGSFGRQP